MSWYCPNCGKEYSAPTNDGMCEKDECYGHYIEQKIGGGTGGGTGDGETPTPGSLQAEMQGLCIMVCDVSGSMDEQVFDETPATKSSLVASALDLAIDEFRHNPMTKQDNAYIAIIAFGDSAQLINDSKGKPFIKSVSSLLAEFPNKGDLGRFFQDVISNDRANVDRRYTNISAGLALAKEIYSAAVMTKDMGRYGFSGNVDIIIHQIDPPNSNGIPVPNIRVLAYSDGEHNPSNSEQLRNAFESVSPSPLLAAFIGSGDEEGAKQMKEIATECPVHSKPGFYLINSLGRHAQLRNVFHMATGASGFCPACLLALGVVGGSELKSNK